MDIDTRHSKHFGRLTN